MISTDLQVFPHQDDSPLAVVDGEPVATLPEDLYIPPDALEVFLETFEGPLDLLLYLIRKQNLDILNIPIAEITRQYMDYVELMRNSNLDLAAEYLVMAALLAEIKSRILLPRHEEIEEEEDDPRAELVRRLQEYERFKQVAIDINELPRQERDHFPSEVEVIRQQVEKAYPDIDLKEIVFAFQAILKRVDLKTSHQIQRESLSVRERMSQVLAKLDGDNFIEFQTLFSLKEGRLGVVVSFLAVLELLKEQLIDMVQAEAYAPIYVKAMPAIEE